MIDGPKVKKEESLDSPDKKVKHELQDNEELVEYVVIDGVRKKRCIRHERRKKGLT